LSSALGQILTTLIFLSFVELFFYTRFRFDSMNLPDEKRLTS